MDPILLKAVREFLVTMARVKASGVAVTPAHQEEFFRTKTGGKYGIADAQQLLGGIDTSPNPRNVGRSFAQGAAFDFGDELLGMLPEAMGGGEGAKEDMRLRQDLFREQHPYWDAGAGLAGGVASAVALPGGGAVAGGRGAASAIARAAARGALYGAGAGAVSGLGRGEGSFVERAPGAVLPMALGAAGGAVIGGGAAGLKVKFSPEARAMRRVNHAIDESPGGIEGVAGENIGMNIAARGEHATLGDLSDRLRLEQDFAVNNSDDALARIAPEVVERQRNAPARLLEDQRTVMGERPNAVVRAAELKQAADEYGKTAYTALRKANKHVPLDNEGVAVLRDPVVGDALDAAHVTANIGPSRSGSGPQVVGFRELHDVKRALDGAIGVAQRAGDGNKMERLIDARDVVLRQLGKADGFKDVNHGYHVLKSTQRALAAGLKAWAKEDPAELADAMQALEKNPAALEQFRYGLAARLYARLANVGKNRDEANALLNASSALEKKLEVAFGTRDKFDRFMFRVGKEAQLARAKGTFGNSATQRRAQAAGFDPLEMGIGLAEGGPASRAGLVSSLYKMARGPMDRATAREVGKLVATKGTKNVEELLMSLLHPEPIIGRGAQRVAPVGVGGLMGNVGH